MTADDRILAGSSDPKFTFGLNLNAAYKGFDLSIFFSYQIGGKMYACADMVDFDWVAVKCDPDEAQLLRERYDEVGTASHFDKRHWNGIRTTGDLPDTFIREQIRNSYMLVLRQNVSPKSLREEILAYVGEHGLPE